MLKTTSLASSSPTGSELFSRRPTSRRQLQVIPLLIVASIWYLAMTSMLYVGQYYLERYFARGSARELPPTPVAADPPRRALGRPRPDRDGPSSVPAAPRPHGPWRADGQGRGRSTSASAASRCCAGSRSRSPRRGDVRDRPVGVGQVDLPALHQPPREDRQRPALGRRRSRRLPPARRRSSTSCATRGRQAPRRDRDGLPALQPLPAQDGARERDRGAVQVRSTLAQGGDRAGARRCSTASASPTSSRPTPPSSPAASSSASRSRGRSR
jgi:hypothetical protein